ncbi:MAG: hypothetical protein JWN58_2028 [Gammaproteobacteria bacterium]|jgi:hypothetical protein|nr:hypothetical protein [Gammaproteobacteria bacterium]
METAPTFTIKECRRDLIWALYPERRVGAGRYNSGMNSLETECLELKAAGVIDEATASRAVALERGSIFSVFEELRFALYAAVAAITTGLGLLLKENLNRIGAAALIGALALAACGCYATALRTLLRGKTRSIGGDYVLLLGALIASADLAYAESQFHWLGSEWQWHVLILAAFHAATAYVFNSRLLLSASLASVAGWFGIEGRIATLFDTVGSSGNLGMHAIICAATILVWRWGNRRLGGSVQFETVFEHFAANIGFWGALALCLTPGSRLAGVAILLALAAACLIKALRSAQEMFAVYGAAYTALALCCLEAQVTRRGLSAALLELATVVAGALLLWNFHRRLKRAAA